MTNKTYQFALFLAATVLFVLPLHAQQQDGYLGPGVLSRGADGIGTRGGGEDLNMKFFARVGGYYESGGLTGALDSNGKLVAGTPGRTGEDVSLGAYGSHQWRRSVLGLEYTGTYRRTSGNNGLSGTTHSLNLGYSRQISKKWVLDFRQLAASADNATRTLNSSAGVLADAQSNLTLQPTSLLFDNRYTSAQTSFDANYALSSRTIFTMGGDGFISHYQNSNLVGARGYSLRGNVERRISKYTSVGAGYTHTHYDFKKIFGESDIDSLYLSLGHRFDANWVLSVQGGLYRAEVQGLRSVAINPLVTALTGIFGTTTQTYYARTIQPSGNVTLTRNLRHGAVSLTYARTVRPGNGVQLTSRSESAGLTYGYSPIRKLNLSASGGYNSLSSYGLNLGRYRVVNFGAGASYALTSTLSLDANYINRDQQLSLGGLNRRGYTASIGIAYNPNNIPISVF